MIYLNGTPVSFGSFPDGTCLLKLGDNAAAGGDACVVEWRYESDAEMARLLYLTGYLRAHSWERITLALPYIPNARQDRVKESCDVFTLRYFAAFINWLRFDSVTVVDPHSTVSEALIDRVDIVRPDAYIAKAIASVRQESDRDLLAFYPDEGAMKRYAKASAIPYAFGVKQRDWKTGKITGLDVIGDTEKLSGSDVLMIDDICSKGGTFFHAAQELKKRGVQDIYLYVTHCERSIFDGKVFSSCLIRKVYTTDSIFLEEANSRAEQLGLSDRIEVLPLA